MYVVVLITAPGKKETDSIAQALIKNKLAACVNIIEKVNSLFWWQGKIDKSRETLLLVKTKKPHLNKLIKRVRSIHSYEVAEIIALPIITGNKKYLEWIDASTG